MDSLFSLQAIAAGVIFLGTLLPVAFAFCLPKQQRGEVLRRVGRWFQGY
jgi:threonine/homoserine/homoserine lactone efflux protein